jgi:hypothetical protein
LVSLALVLFLEPEESLKLRSPNCNFLELPLSFWAFTPFA